MNMKRKVAATSSDRKRCVDQGKKVKQIRETRRWKIYRSDELAAAYTNNILLL